MEAIGAFSGIFGIIILIAAILAFLMPFFVLRIRNELITMNKKMSTMIQLLGGDEPAADCHWCKTSFPSSQANVLKGRTLCPECWSKVNKEAFE